MVMLAVAMVPSWVGMAVATEASARQRAAAEYFILTARVGICLNLP